MNRSVLWNRLKWILFYSTDGVAMRKDRLLIDIVFGNPVALTRINDGLVKEYRQPHPKERVLAALRDKLLIMPFP